MLGQALIDVGVIRVEQFKNASVFLNHRLKEQLGLFLHRAAKLFIEGGESPLIRSPIVEVAQLQPLPDEILHQLR